jgi:tripartite-type tricarboxylate transporter receptor subunit TctC
MDSSRTFKLSRRAVLAAVGLGTFTLARPALAQASYPSRPITIVVPTPAGGGTDYAARLIAEPMGVALSVPVVVENRPGGNDIIGLSTVARSKPDGYTLLMGYCGTMAGRAAIGGTGEIDTRRDFVPIGQVTDTPQLMVVHPSLPVKDLREFIAYAKQRPGKIDYASAGNGSMHHLGTELLKNRTGIDLVHIPYRGTGETISDLIAGRVQFYMNSPPPLAQLVRDGRLRPVSVSSNQRHPGFPEVPSLTENGLSDFPLNVWFALFAPREVPPPLQRMLTDKLRVVLNDRDLQRRAFESGALVSFTPPEEMAARLDSEINGWKAVATAANIRAD